MKRSLRRHIERAFNRTWSQRGSVPCVATVVLSFPPDAFGAAAEWSPGEGFEVTAEHHAWLRSNGDGTSTAVVAGVGPKELPAADGGRWERPEVWTVTAPDTTPFLASGAMWDKPHRITWLLDEPGAVIRREPYAGHPAADAVRYWCAFADRWGFIPRRMYRGAYPFADRRRWVRLTAEAGRAPWPGERQLLEASTILARRFSAKARVYAFDPARGTTGDPIGGLRDRTLDDIVDRLGIAPGH